MLRPFHERPRNFDTLMISTGEKKCRALVDLREIFAIYKFRT